MFSRFRSALLSSIGAVDGTLPGAEFPALGAGEPSPRPVKFPYARPRFLQLDTEDELQVAGDKVIRPIIVPRDCRRLPWNAGYAEAVNAGKSKRNEDNAAVYVGELRQPNVGPVGADGRQAGSNVRYYYFGMFDGHAGHGASVAAAAQLHHIIHDKLSDIVDHLLPPDPLDPDGNRPITMWIPAEEVSVEKMVTGALEAAFHDMDALIGEDRYRYDMRGGCTAVVALLLLGRLYLANAGDSRAALCRDGRVCTATSDFTPETERQRVRQLAFQQPHLTGGEFTHLDFSRRVTRRDIGKRVLYRDAYMTGWAYKTVTETDLKFPIVCGDGKRSRVCATIGVTRGFGDHDLKAQTTSVNIKPFLSSQPQVLVIDVEQRPVSENDVLVLATDGLWDVISNERAAELVQNSLSRSLVDAENKQRYRCTSAAQDLVMAARGKLKERLWRLPDGTMATIDDISVFVVPLLSYREEHLTWKMQQEAASLPTPPASAPSGVRQVSDTAELDRYQSLVEQCGRPANQDAAPAPATNHGAGSPSATSESVPSTNQDAASPATSSQIPNGVVHEAEPIDGDFADAVAGSVDAADIRLTQSSTVNSELTQSGVESSAPEEQSSVLSGNVNHITNGAALGAGDATGTAGALAVFPDDVTGEASIDNVPPSR